MEIRKYTQPSMTAALRFVRSDFMDDVVIVSSNEVIDSSGEPALEVIAAGTLKNPAQRQHAQSKPQQKRMGRRVKAGTTATVAKDTDRPVFVPTLDPMIEEPAQPQPQFQAQSSGINRVKNEIAKEQESNRLLEEINSLKTQISNLNTHFTAPAPAPVKTEEDPFEAGLIKNGVDREILDWTRQQTGARGEQLERAMEQMIPDTKPIVFNGEAPHIMAFAGPTGVGKTTTLAKIAARFALEENKSVALITIDTYRTGATDQLSIYAGLIGIPIEIATKPRELKTAIGKHLDKQLILIDTAGRSHHNRKQMQELHEFIGQIPEISVSLVLNANIRYDDLKDVTQSFEPLGIDNCIVTKTDETLKYGNLLNIAVVVEKPIPFITNGQRVPEDIRQLRKAELVDAIVGRSALLA